MRNAHPNDPGNTYSALLEAFFCRQYGCGEARLLRRLVGEARA